MPRVDLILTPVDFSPTSEGAAAYARWLAARLRARLILVHALGPCPDPAERDAPPGGDEQARRLAQRDLEDLAARLATGAGGDVRVATAVEVVDGDRSPAVAIVDSARGSRADLIVMATHGRSTVRRLLLGSVAAEVVGAAPCPVLVVK